MHQESLIQSLNLVRVYFDQIGWKKIFKSLDYIHIRYVNTIFIRYQAVIFYITVCTFFGLRPAKLCYKQILGFYFLMLNHLSIFHAYWILKKNWCFRL